MSELAIVGMFGGASHSIFGLKLFLPKSLQMPEVLLRVQQHHGFYSGVSHHFSGKIWKIRWWIIDIHVFPLPWIWNGPLPHLQTDTILHCWLHTSLYSLEMIGFTPHYPRSCWLNNHFLLVRPKKPTPNNQPSRMLWECLVPTQKLPETHIFSISPIAE